MIDLSLLNPNQKEAVLSDAKYLRIIAGAGSGKTRVLTMRIAHLIEEEGIPPFRILAITFTNKAANEMKERIRNMLVGVEVQPWISTIHSLCVRILREDIICMGYPRNFTIMDTDDQKSVIKEAVKRLELENENITPMEYINYISNNKSEDISAEQAKIMAGSFHDDQVKASVYAFYLDRQKQLFALDFDDLILWTVHMFAKFPEVLHKWQRKFSYILVDEFQDIDRLQYQLIRFLGGKDNSIYVVGDPDQTIYTWRGADVNIIMNFVRDFPNAKTVILNENYRSSADILKAANSVIANNRNRMKKELFTSKKSEGKIIHYAAISDEYQAAYIADEISTLHRNGKKYKDIAILYRSNYLSRSIERGLIDLRIPYVIYGGTRFYERQEVKDILCYLRMASGSDDLALQRILNRPRRGIGPKTMDMIATVAHEQGISMYEVLKQEGLFSGKIARTLQDFVTTVEKWKKRVADPNTSLVDLYQDIIEESGYREMLSEDKEKGAERLENLKSLGDDLNQFEQNDPKAGLDEYLQTVSLYTDREEGEVQDAVQLMTVHSAKGLEFDTVFVTDLNEGIFPNERALSETSRGLEEERRLAYVAFTRARHKLYLTEAGGFSYILQRVRTTSRFIKEIDEECIHHVNAPKEKEVSSFSTTSYRGETMASSLHSITQASAGGSLKKGDKVTHKIFGEGVVLKIRNNIAEIAFPYPAGVKKIMANHPSLVKSTKK